MKAVLRLLSAVVLISSGIALAPGTPASAAVAPGSVLSSSSAALPPQLGARATGRRVQYVSTNADGITITATGLVLTPKTGKQNRVVVWAHGTTGLADRCAPSTNQNVFWPEAQDAVEELLKRGWTVAAPDYPGLGTPQAHPYLVGNSEGRSIIDSVRAARNLDPALSTQYAIDGHSQGGQGALFASQLAPSYDGNLVLRGTASIAPVSNVDMLAPIIPGTPGQGYLVMGLYGLAAVEPTFNPNTVLAPPARAKSAVLTTGCLNEILAAYQNLTAEQLLIGGALPAPVVAKLARNDNPAQTSPSAPMLVVQGTDDAAVPAFVTDYLVAEQLEPYAPPVEYVTVPGGTHDSAVTDTTVLVADWIAARFV
ncbi:alpha/beta fold hydrolase [Paractinoplanes rishiriensis]|nr:alpha/beta fold hydrolase [Actinoplanes rishiriensis]